MSCPPWRRWLSQSIPTTTCESASERCSPTKALTSWTSKIPKKAVLRLIAPPGLSPPQLDLLAFAPTIYCRVTSSCYSHGNQKGCWGCFAAVTNMCPATSSAVQAPVEVVLRCNLPIIFASGCWGQTAKPFQKTNVQCFTASKDWDKLNSRPFWSWPTHWDIAGCSATSQLQGAVKTRPSAVWKGQNSQLKSSQKSDKGILIVRWTKDKNLLLDNRVGASPRWGVA